VLAWALAARGHDVVGVEPSEFLMREAEARRSQEPPSAAAHVQFVHADLRSLRLQRQFKTVFAPKGALTFLPGTDAVDAVLATVAQHLASDGAFAFEVGGLQGHANVEGPLGRSLFTAHLRERKGAGAIRRVRRVTLTAVELEGALEASGLQAHERYGDFTGRPWEERDDRQIVVAAKK
jgi:O-methyltransferase involved in polyketide biosynthesis